MMEQGVVKLNPYDAQSLGIRMGDIVNIKSKHGKAELKVNLTMDVDQSTAFVAAEEPAVRGLFDYTNNDDIISFIPTEVEIWRKG
jgi:anaerobic selenocysteine-containing dehydrogenase